MDLTTPLPSIEIGPETLAAPERALALEWLVTDGTGSYACSTAWGCNTRRYHGLLVAAARPPAERVVLLAGLQEEVEVGGRLYPLSTSEYPDVLHPDGHKRLIAFRLDPLPEWTYAAGLALIRRRVVPLRGRRAFAVCYDLRGAAPPALLRVRPTVAGRQSHALLSASASFRCEYPGERQVLVASDAHPLPLHLRASAGAFCAEPLRFHRVTYRRERERGFNAEEELFSPGAFEVAIARETPFVIAAGCEPLPETNFEREHRAACGRLAGLMEAARAQSPLEQALVLAADAFIVQCDNGGKTILAGYPWFDAWGRDAFIALEGLTLATGRFADARAILLTFAQRIRGGLVPNFLAADPADDAFNSIDASLWFIHAIARYLLCTGDDDTVRRQLWPRVREILQAYVAGTRFGIRVDADGLLTGGSADTQLTWMDAEIEGFPVTARQGKAVEVNALWYNALRAGAWLAGRLGASPSPMQCGTVALGGERASSPGDKLRAGPADARRYRALARTAKQAFDQAFWCEERQALYDIVSDADMGAASRGDCALRPNMVLALSLPWPVLAPPRWRAVAEAVQARLLTPWGLRTLDPGDAEYHGRYLGSPAQRDRAYHQGTVWPWLLGPYFDAYLRLHRHSALAYSHMREALDPWRGHLLDAGLGSVSEVFDGDPPHLPRGCIAQAWSVAELLRLLSLNRPHLARDPAADRR